MTAPLLALALHPLGAALTLWAAYRTDALAAAWASPDPLARWLLAAVVLARFTSSRPHPRAERGGRAVNPTPRLMAGFEAAPFGPHRCLLGRRPC